jgi:hypothetical protein
MTDHVDRRVVPATITDTTSRPRSRSPTPRPDDAHRHHAPTALTETTSRPRSPTPRPDHDDRGGPLHELDPPTARWLTSPEGLAAVAATTTALDAVAGQGGAAAERRVELEVATRARQRWPEPGRAPAVVAAAIARRRARAAWPDAERLLFTRTGLEQASDPVVSAWRARRFAAARDGVWDLGAGIGGDTLALGAVTAPVRAIDLDTARLVLLTHNAAVRGLAVETETADALTVRPPRGVWLHADPGRRRTDGSRVSRLRDHHPPVGALVSAHAGAAGLAIVLSPAVDLDDPDLPDGAELEFVAIGDRLVEAVAWLGDLAVPGRAATATILTPACLRSGEGRPGQPASGARPGPPASGGPAGGPASGARPGPPASGAPAGEPASGPRPGPPASGAPAGEPPSGPPPVSAASGPAPGSEPTPRSSGPAGAVDTAEHVSLARDRGTRVELPVGEVADHLVEIAAPAVRARLHDAIGAELGARRLARGRALLTVRGEPPPSPWYVARPVVAVLPARPKAVRAWLRGRDAPELELAFHGVAADAADWWRGLGRPPRGPNGWRLELVRLDTGAMAIVTGPPGSG